MTPPAIGICAAVERVQWGVWTETVTMAPRSYATAVQRAGGIALLLPPDDGAAEAPDELLDLIDGLILAGGADVDPASYGAVPDPETKGTWPERDRFELGITHRALERGIPVLGICRGMQLLNVACGGTLDQHLPARIGSERHRHTPGTFGDHDVQLVPGSLAAEAAQTLVLGVRSHHHQGVDELGEGLEVTGRSVDDNIVEAIELPDRGFGLGVLWHPEEDLEDRVVGALVSAAKTEVPAP